MIRRSEHSLARQIAHDLITMSAVRGARDERLVAQAQEIIEPHRPTHSLGVDDEAFALQLLSDPAIAVEAVGQCDVMDRIANVGVVALGFTRREMAILAARDSRGADKMLNLMDRLFGRACCFVFALRFSAALKSLMSAKSSARHAPGLGPEARRQVARPCEKNRGRVVGDEPDAPALRCAPSPGPGRPGRPGPRGSPVAIFRLAPSWVRATAQTGCAMARPRPTRFIHASWHPEFLRARRQASPLQNV